jgi:GrpB-like predicted nucleotidyltransferase (UPF0157 family)
MALRDRSGGHLITDVQPERDHSVPQDGKITILGKSPTNVEACVDRVVSLLRSHVPFACVEHVGSTSVPGCIGKGDIDILVRVSPSEFERSRGILDKLLDRSDRNEASDNYVEYDWTGAEQQAAVQLVAIGGTHDDFLRFRDHLLANRHLVQRYNALKLSYQGCSTEEYRKAKDEFIARVLADDTAHAAARRTSEEDDAQPCDQTETRAEQGRCT